MYIEADPTRRTEAESGASEETDREREVERGSTGQLVARHDIYIYTHIHNLQSFFLFSFLTSKQVSWPRTLLSGTPISRTL
jgi:hypothetical protein